MNAKRIQKKTVSRNIAITLGIICIILLVDLVGTVVSYKSRDSQIQSLQSEADSLTMEVNFLKAPQLHKIAVEFYADNHPTNASPYVSIRGVIFNSGSDTAHNVVLSVRVLDASDNLLRTSNITDMGEIVGKSEWTFDYDVSYSSGDAESVEITLFWSG